MRRAGWFTIFFALGMLVFFVGGYWAEAPSPLRQVAKVLLPLLFLLLWLLGRRVETLRALRPVFLGFLAASSAFLAGWWVSGPLLRLSGVRPGSVEGLALAKLFDAVPMVATLLAVAFLGGWRPRDLLLRRGRVRLWLAWGLGSFLLFGLLFVLPLLQSEGGSQRLLAILPWTLLFVLTNGFLEELHFRGLLLRPLEPFLGPRLANLCVASFFTLTHAPVAYAPDKLLFLLALLLLALLWGHVIQRSQSLWGAVLFHAGADLLVIQGIYESYGAVP